MRDTRMELHWGRLMRCCVERPPTLDYGQFLDIFETNAAQERQPEDPGQAARSFAHQGADAGHRRDQRPSHVVEGLLSHDPAPGRPRHLRAEHGRKKLAPKTLGNRKYKVRGKAPGTYVLKQA